MSDANAGLNAGTNGEVPRPIRPVHDLAAAALSPSLSGGWGTSIRPAEAYEIKYALDEQTAQLAEAHFASFLASDPNAQPSLNGAYAVSSLYTDTVLCDVLERQGRYANRKYRVRRYGDSISVYCERKTVRERRVRKRRSVVPLSELPRRMELCSGETEWFARQVSARLLHPVCRIRYVRRAMFGAIAGERMRVTFDRSIRGSLLSGWSFDAASEERHLLEGVVVCEFKFAGSMPAPMKAIASSLCLVPAGVSKYRECRQAFGAGLARPASHHGDKGGVGA